MVDLQYYFYLLKPISSPREGVDLTEYLSTLSVSDKQILKQHFAYMEKLKVENRILIGGPFLDAKGLVIILQVHSKDEAKQLISQEPTIIGKLFKVVESHPMQIAVLSST